MEPTIRPFEPEDRSAVEALAVRLQTGMAPWRDPTALQQAVLGWIASACAEDSDSDALVAEVDASVVGFVSLSSMPHFAGETDAYIGELIVDEHAEGRGIGSALVAAVERLARDRDIRCITLHTGAANHRALDFYERLGYQAEDVKLTKLLSTA
ncbi:MAG: GNAT family N-acetyltransferase [Ilumatobacter sp.]|uniref:GNAT family N-acetyltransferase n=1 Tax=Ilumatobacter sp. TaxID=1967498 RepID=UPI0026362AA5|nr:GNAT family N-acetyltransferase [Ilumatobacter sp.]MDJ0767541.1 GNAT family N-acetyltransferase [Ilumatobacter sp.]